MERRRVVGAARSRTVWVEARTWLVGVGHAATSGAYGGTAVGRRCGSQSHGLGRSTDVAGWRATRRYERRLRWNGGGS